MESSEREKVLTENLCIAIDNKLGIFSPLAAKELQKYWIKELCTKNVIKEYIPTNSWIRSSPRLYNKHKIIIEETTNDQFELILNYLCEHISKENNYNCSFFWDSDVIFQCFKKRKLYSIIFESRNIKKIVGYFCIEDIINGKVKIEIIEIFESYRKRNIGKETIFQFESISKEKGLNEIQCNPIKTAEAFWISIGFNPTKENSKIFFKVI